MRIQDVKTKIYTQGELLGVDLRGNRSQSHATKMKNLLSIDSVLRKRNGFLDIACIENTDYKPQKINGIYPLGEYKIIHAGEYLFKCPDDFSPPSNGVLSSSEIVISDILLENEPLCGAVHGGMLWLVSYGELLVFDGEKLKKVYNSDLAYVPKTRIEIRANDLGGTYKEGQSNNLLSTKIINTAIGDFLQRADYELECEPDLNKGIYVKNGVNLEVGATQSKTPFMAYTKPLKVDESQVGSVVGSFSVNEIYKMLNGEGTNYGFDMVDEVSIYFKEPIRVYSLDLIAQATGKVPRVKLTLGANDVYDTESPTNASVINLSNVLEGKLIDGICFYGNNEGARLKEIAIFASMGYQGECEMIYDYAEISENTSYYPTLVLDSQGRELELYSDYEGKINALSTISFHKSLNGVRLRLHYPAPSDVKGNANIEIAFHKKETTEPYFKMARECRSRSGKQALAFHFGKNEIYYTDFEQGFAYIPSENHASIGNEGEIVEICQMHDFSLGVFKSDSSFYITLDENGADLQGAMENVGCIGKRLAQTVNRDTLVLSHDGVYGFLGRGTNGGSMRSGAINTELTKRSAQNGFAISYQGRLYLFLDELCYIADTRFRHYPDGRLDDSFEYEWFVMDSLGACYACVLDGKLYLGTSEGKIKVMHEGFSDIEYKRIGRGDYTLSLDENELTRLTLNPALGFKDGDKIVINGAYCRACKVLDYAYYDGKYTLLVGEDKLIDSGGALCFYDGMELYLDDGYAPQRAQICDVHYSLGTVVVSVDTAVSEPKHLLLKCDTELTLKETEEQSSFFICDKGKQRLFYYDKAVLIGKAETPVVSEYVSAGLSLDSALAKTLHRVSFSLLPCTCGSVTVGYEGDNTVRLSGRKMGRTVCFDQMSFDSLSLGTELEKTVNIRCLERGISDVIVKIKSSDASDFGLKGFSLVYTESGLLKGGRL